MGLEKHGHGGDVWTAAELYGIDKNGFLDFSSNMNPLGPPEAAGAILSKEWRRELSRYPDPDCRELRSVIAGLYGVPEASVLIGNGAAELIDLAVRSSGPKKVGLLTPCFSEYGDAAEKAGAELIRIPLGEDRGFLPDPETSEAGLKEADLLFLGHPNNPTGRLLPESFLEHVLKRGKTVILDEAFIDFSGEEDARSYIRKAPETEGLLVVRSLTKFYSIPGLRLGFIVGHPESIRRMKRLQVPWSVNALAQRIGAAMLGDGDFTNRTLAWIREERPWLTERLRELGLEVTESVTNYLLFRLPDGWPFTIRELQEAMGRRGILIRDASTFPGLTDRYGRTAVKRREDNLRLLAGLKAAMGELRGEREEPLLQPDAQASPATDALAPSIMLQGTASDVGKSILTAALCRIFTQDGERTAPFKSQNMSLNSYITPDGREIGRAQGLQADACRTAATTDMNPILLKPKKDMVSQVVVHGKPLRDYEARAYREEYLVQAEGIVKDALHRLRREYGLIVIEGAGSPAEVNLKAREIVNMRVAGWADAPVLLVADIDRGGVFASILGTMEILEPHERDRVQGFIINKFRGDVTLLKPGIDWLEEKTGKPVVGVIPYLPNLGLEDEDSASLDNRLAGGGRAPSGRPLDLAVIRLPRLSNFTDFDPLPEEPDVSLRYVMEPSQLGRPDAILLPGSKNTVEDLVFLRETGLADAILAYVAGGGELAGICAGYQMLGESLLDPEHLESDRDQLAGLGLLPAITVFTPDKRTVRVAGSGTVPGAADGTVYPVAGFEIHMGRTSFRSPVAHPFTIARSLPDGRPGEELHGDGAEALEGRVWGTYVHGILHNDAFRRSWLNKLRSRKGLPPVTETLDLQARREAALDRLAEHVRSHLDMEHIYEMIGKKGGDRS